MTTLPQQNLDHDLNQLSCRDRNELLDGPSILLIASHSGTSFDYTHQCSSAKGVVTASRNRQLKEEAESDHRPFAIEFPVRALCAASRAFKSTYMANPDVYHIPVDMGGILPGYAMCVLDWLVRALRGKQWVDFLPKEIPFVDEDQWYWVYCYSAMCCLGMDEFAGGLRDSIMRVINNKTLKLDCENYIRLLRAIPSSDALVVYLSERTAWQMSQETLRLSRIDIDYIATRFPHFAALVNKDIKS